MKLPPILLAALASTIALSTPARADPAPALTLKAHPRLWVPAETIHNLAGKLHSPYLKSSAARIIADADWLCSIEPIAQNEVRTNQQGTRLIASHLKCLTSAYVLTRDPKYRTHAMRHLANILNWRHISCEANINTPIENKKFFCLSYGEHAADIALMYDVLRPDITPREMKVFNDVLDRFYLWQALRAHDRNPWWVNKEWSNWNGVCAGGMGMLALAFYDDRPEARKLIPFVEKSLAEYFKSYITNGGGNHEGTGYWNYGMHYAVRYLLSYENATGTKHPIFQVPEIGRTLHFPLDFHRLTFGDNDGWHPTGMFFMLANRMNQPDAAMRAAAYLMHEVPAAPSAEDRPRLGYAHHGDTLYAAAYIPRIEAMERLKAERAANPKPLARVYEGLGWAALADDTAFPRMRLTARGGSSAIRGHGHHDLLSFKCMVDGVRFIEDQAGGVMSVNYTGRGQDLYSRSPAGKSTLFVDGLGCAANAECTTTEVVEADDMMGIRIDGSGVYGRGRRFVGRLFLLVDSKYWLVVDTAPGRLIEARFHTHAEVEAGEDWARLTKRAKQARHDTSPVSDEARSLTMTFATLTHSTMQHSAGMPSYPRQQTRIIRWMTTDRHKDNLHVTALNPGNEKLHLQLAGDDAGYTIRVTSRATPARTIALTRALTLRD